MGNTDTKLNFRKAIVQLTSKSQVRCNVVLHCSWCCKKKEEKTVLCQKVKKVSNFAGSNTARWRRKRAGRALFFAGGNAVDFTVCFY